MPMLEVDGYRIDPRTRRVLTPGGEPVALTAKACDTLLYLIEHRERVVSKDDLLAAVWPGRVIEENTLTQAISLARRALGSNASDHRHIVTMPGRGYRFVAEVVELDDAVDLAPPAGPLAVSIPSDESMVGPGATSVVRPDPTNHPGRVYLLLGLLLAVLAVLAAVAFYKSREPLVPVVRVEAGPPVALAVLPFRPLAGGARDEGLELGMADTLITRLSRSSGLQVRSLESSTRSGNPQGDARQAGRILGAAYVVQGTTQVIGNDVRVNARLIRVAEGNTVWAETFDAPLARVFTLQDRIADGVTSALALAPLGTAVAQSPCDGADAVAYRAYLRGYYQLNRPEARRMTDALAAFRQAIDRDPTCARAWAGTAFAYRALVMTGDRDPRELFPLAKAAVAQALRIDPDSAEAYASKGFIEFWYDWDWPRAEASLRHAIALNPNLAEAHMALAHLLFNIGRPGEAVPHARQAAALDPLSPIVNSLTSTFLRGGGHMEEADRHLAKTLELEPDAWVALRVRSGRAMAQGDFASALRDLERAVAISGGHSNTLAGVAKVHMRAGNRASAERVLAELEARRAAGYVPATSLAVAANALGDTERVLDLLEQGYRERDVRMSFLLLDWPQLRGQPRYQTLLRRMQLPATQPEGLD